MSSLLLKQSRIVKRLALYDENNVDMASDISYINTSCKVEAFLGKEKLNDALKDADLVVIGDDPLSTPHTCFDLMAPKICDYAKAISHSSPNAIVVIAASPVNVLVPLLSEVIMECGTYDSNKIIGSAAVDNTRANCILASHLNLSPQKVTLPVIGGTSKETRIPLVSQAKPSLSLQRDLILKITEDIRNIDNYVFSLKKSPEALNKAYSTVRFLHAIFSGLKGEPNSVSIAFTRTSLIPEVDYFSLPIQFGRFGIQKTYGLPPTSSFEKCLIDLSIDSLKIDIEQARLFLKSKETMSESFSKLNGRYNKLISEPILSKNNNLSVSKDLKVKQLNIAGDIHGSKDKNLEDPTCSNSFDNFTEDEPNEVKNSECNKPMLIMKPSEEGNTFIPCTEIIKELSSNKLSQIRDKEQKMFFTKVSACETRSLKEEKFKSNNLTSLDVTTSKNESISCANLGACLQDSKNNSLKVGNDQICDSVHKGLEGIEYSSSSVSLVKPATNSVQNSEFNIPLMTKKNSEELPEKADSEQAKLFLVPKENTEIILKRNCSNSKSDPAELFYFKSDNSRTISELPKIDDGGKGIPSDGTGASKAKHMKRIVISNNTRTFSLGKCNKNKPVFKRISDTYTLPEKLPFVSKNSSIHESKQNKLFKLVKNKKNEVQIPIKVFEENESKSEKNMPSFTYSFDKKFTTEQENEMFGETQNYAYDKNITSDIVRAQERTDFSSGHYPKKIFVEQLIKQVNEKAIEEEKTLSGLTSQGKKTSVSRNRILNLNKFSELKVNKNPNEKGLILFSEDNKSLTKYEGDSDKKALVGAVKTEKTFLRGAIDNLNRSSNYSENISFLPKKVFEKQKETSFEKSFNINEPVRNQPLYPDMINREKKSTGLKEQELAKKSSKEEKHIFLKRLVGKENEKQKPVIPNYFFSSPSSQFKTTLEEKMLLIKENFKPSTKLCQLTVPKEVHSIKNAKLIYPAALDNTQEAFKKEETFGSYKEPYATKKTLTKNSKSQKLSLDAENEKTLYYLKQRNVIFKMLRGREKSPIGKSSNKDDTVDNLIDNLFEEVNSETLPLSNKSCANDERNFVSKKKEEHGPREMHDRKPASNDSETDETLSGSITGSQCIVEHKEHSTDLNKERSPLKKSKPCFSEELSKLEGQCDAKEQIKQKISNLPTTTSYSKFQKVNDNITDPSVVNESENIPSFGKYVVSDVAKNPLYPLKNELHPSSKITLNKFSLLVKKEENTETIGELPPPSLNNDGIHLKDTNIVNNNTKIVELSKNQENQLFRSNNKIVFSRLKGNKLQNFTIKKSHLPPVEQIEKQSERNNSSLQKDSKKSKKTVGLAEPKLLNSKSSDSIGEKVNKGPLLSLNAWKKSPSYVNFSKNCRSPFITFTHNTIYSNSKGKKTVHKRHKKVNPVCTHQKTKPDTDGFLSTLKMAPRTPSNSKVRSVARFSTSSLHARRKSPSRVIVDIINEKTKINKNCWQYPASSKKIKYTNTIHETRLKILGKDFDKKNFETKNVRAKCVALQKKVLQRENKSNREFVPAGFPPPNFVISNKENKRTVEKIFKSRILSPLANKRNQTLPVHPYILSRNYSNKDNSGKCTSHHKGNAPTPQKISLKHEKYVAKNSLQAKPYTSLVTSIGESTSSYVFRENIFKGRKFYHTNCEKRINCFSKQNFQHMSTIFEKFQKSRSVEKLYKPYTRDSAWLEYRRASRLPPANNLLYKIY